VPPLLRVFRAATLCACLPICSVAVSVAAGEAERLYTVAPDFVRTDLSGRPLRLDQFRGRVVLLNFWATWCAPCIEEIPTFSRWQRHFGNGGLQIIGVSMDDDEATVRRFVAKRGIPYPIMMGDAKLGELFGGVFGLPQSFLIDARGRIVYRSVGEPNIETLRSKIAGLIGIH
jgi:thiol-disulfide isomerase/thioredoxin